MNKDIYATMPANLPSPEFDANALRVLNERYFATKPNGGKETPVEFLWRVAYAIALAEGKYAPDQSPETVAALVDQVAREFYALLCDRDFMPNTPCLVNAGRPLSMLSACFVLPVPDSMEGIFESVKTMALVQKAGGGTGFAFSNLRAQGTLVSSTGKDASGPISFMKVFNAATDSIKQGGVRRGANMGVLRVDHPDVFAFMRCKKELDAENRAVYNRLSDTGRYTDAQLTHIKQELLQTQMNNFNISIGITDEFMAAVKADSDFALRDPKTKAVVKSVRASEIFEAIVEGAWQNGEPGVLFLDHPQWNAAPELGPIEATNPCLTADTLVAVADGRGHVAIGELAAEDKDVPVFCYDDKGTITVRTMRHPRLTGKQQAIFKMTLDDGSTVRATANHKFRLRNGEYVEMQDLAAGDSLKIMTRFQASIQELISRKLKNSNNYWVVKNGDGTEKMEHRFIAEFHQNTSIPKASVVHHIDFDSLNNAPTNLRIMTKGDHDALHGDMMVGDANPMRRAKTEWSTEKLATYAQKHRDNGTADANPNFSGFTHEEIQFAALELSAALGRRFSNDDWQDMAEVMNLPRSFTAWRRNHLNGNITSLAKWAANELGFEHIDTDPRILRTYQAALAESYDASIVDETVMVTKRCEGCDTPFSVNYWKREIGFCSVACNLTTRNKNPEVTAKRHASLRLVYDRNAAQVREQQLDVYTALKAIVVDVQKTQWVQACKERGISPEISRKSSPFRTFADLKEAAAMFNHRVVSIEADGFEDVYNGTVDDFHNFFVGAFESTTDNRKLMYSYINNRNCGEIALHPGDACNLGSINLGNYYNAVTKDVDWARLETTVHTTTRFLDNVVDANVFPVDLITNMVKGNRRLGLGIMGFADLLIKLRIAYGSTQAIALAEQIMGFINSKAEDMGETLALTRGDFPHKPKSIYKDGRPRRNIAYTCIAPTGTISMIAGCSFGCEPYFGIAYTKHVMKDAEGRAQNLYYVLPLFEQVAKAEGFYSNDVLEAVANNRGSLQGLAQVPKLWQDVFTVTADVTVDEHIDMLAAFQKNTGNAVSKTVNAPNDDTRDSVARSIMKAYELGCKGFTYYRDGSRTEQVVTFSKDADIKATPAAAEATTKTERINKDIDALLVRAAAALAS